MHTLLRTAKTFTKTFYPIFQNAKFVPNFLQIFLQN